jgi:hypothetical protein
VGVGAEGAGADELDAGEPEDTPADAEPEIGEPAGE